MNWRWCIPVLGFLVPTLESAPRPLPRPQPISRNGCGSFDGSDPGPVG